MNESTLTHLKILVERAIRPLRASTPRKHTMREELLAHVRAVFEEELARLGDERPALEQAEQRFGNLVELTRQLQETVPASDTVDRLVERLVFPPGESTPRRALRQASVIGFLSLTILLVAWSASSVGSTWNTPVLWYCGSVALSLFLMIFGFYFTMEWMRQALFGPSGRPWRRAALAAASITLFFSVTLFFGMVAQGLGGHDAWSIVPPTVLLTATMPVLMGVMAHRADNRVRHLQEWATLQID